jgi:phage FluMu gp28-like protein
VKVAALANKLPIAREFITKMQLAFEYLPMFLKQGIVEWNKSTIKLANGSLVMADSTTGSSIRGMTFNIVFLDEFAHVPNSVAHEFFMSTYPTISSGKTTKIIIVSTPKGLNMFYKMWMDAVEKRSSYIPIEIHWSMVPGRDAKWKEEVIKNTSIEQWSQEFESCAASSVINTSFGKITIGELYEKLKMEQH